MTFCQRNTDCDESPGKQTPDLSSQVHKSSDNEDTCEFLAIPIQTQISCLKNRLSTVAERGEADGTVISVQRTRTTSTDDTCTPISE
jgi:hypothetical protein